MSVLAISYSVGRPELIESVYGNTSSALTTFWYILDLHFVPLSVRGDLVSYGSVIDGTQQMVGYGVTAGGPVVADMTLAVSGVGTHLFVLAGLIWGGWRASGILTADEPDRGACIIAGASTVVGYAPFMILFGLLFASVSTSAGRVGPAIPQLITYSILLPVVTGAFGGWLHAPSDWIEIYVGEKEADSDEN